MARPFRFSARMPGSILGSGPDVAPAGLFSSAAWGDALTRMEDAGLSSVAAVDHFVIGTVFEPFAAMMAAAGASRHLRNSLAGLLRMAIL